MNEIIDIEELLDKSIKSFNKVYSDKEYQIFLSVSKLREENDFNSFKAATYDTKEYFKVHMTDIYYNENLDNVLNLDEFIDISVRYYSEYIKKNFLIH